MNLTRVDVFSILSCIATIRLVHNGGYIQKRLELFSSPEILLFGRLYLVTKASQNVYQFYSILATVRRE